MPTGDSKLTIVIKAKNDAEKALKGVNKGLDGLKKKMQNHQAAFKKMALAGAAAFGALTVGAGLAIKEAAVAEGSYNKFNTVFAEHKDDMLNFIEDLRKEMPTATHDIVRMAADLQDLLVPLGLARGKAAEMSKGFLDVSNKIAAFNDVDPTEVLEAIKSGLAGSSEPLRRYGVNALETALEAKALEMGLLGANEKMSDLDPTIKNQIRSQALLAQIYDNSSDAINGFTENNDSFIRRQQELNASIKETKKALGEALLPMVDKLLKKILPIVEKIKTWAEENKKMSPILIGVGLALAGIVAALGILGLMLPMIITGFALLISPVGLVIVAIIALIAWITWLASNWDIIVTEMQFAWMEFKMTFVNAFNSMKDAASRIFNAIKNTIIGIWEGITAGIKGQINKIIEVINGLITQLNKVSFSVPSWIPGLGGKSWGFNISKITPLAEGGIVKKPTLAMVGEKEPEAVIPLSRMGGVTINITGNTFMSDEEAAEKIGDMIIGRLKTQTRYAV